MDKQTTLRNKVASCAVCGEEKLLPLELSGLRRVYCPNCQHSQRIDKEAFDYKHFAMGSNAASTNRLQSQAAFIEPHIPANASVLEIGCAAGQLALTLRNSHAFHLYDGIELSPAGKESAKIIDRVFDKPLPTLLETGLIDENSYDVVLSSHCLEHIEDLQATMIAVKQVLKPKGLIFFEVPNRSGNKRLPFDDNRSHYHFFSVSSLTRLLVKHGFEVIAAQTGAWETARYTDSIRVVACPFVLPSTKCCHILSDHALLADVDKVVVWGAGKMSEEMLTHFFDLSRIAFFVDTDTRKHGTRCLGFPVRPPEDLRTESGPVVLIGSLEYEDVISCQIAKKFDGAIRKVIRISDLLS